MIVQLLHLFKAAHRPKYCLHGQRAVHSSLIRTYVAISLPCVQALVFPDLLPQPPPHVLHPYPNLRTYFSSNLLNNLKAQECCHILPPLQPAPHIYTDYPTS